MAGLADLEARGTELWISTQVLREFIAILTRPQTFTRPQPVPLVAARVDHFRERFRVAEDTVAVAERLMDLIRRFPTGGKQVHDANIVATMLTYGIERLLTHNSADFERFVGVVHLVPLGANQGLT